MKKLLSILLLTVLTPFCSIGADVTLAWDPNPEPDVQGYVLYWGEESGVYGNSQGTDQTVLTVTGLVDGNRYFFAVTATNAFGESGPSNEVDYTTPGGPEGDLIARTLFPTNLSPTNVVLVGLVDQLPGEFGVFFEWSGGTNLGAISLAYPAQVIHTDADNLIVTADFPIVPTNYTYRLVVTNMVARYQSEPVTFSTRAPRPVQIRFEIRIIETTALGSKEDQREYLVSSTTIPYPKDDRGNRFFFPRLSFDVEYDQNITVPPSIQ